MAGRHDAICKGMSANARARRNGTQKWQQRSLSLTRIVNSRARAVVGVCVFADAHHCLQTFSRLPFYVTALNSLNPKVLLVNDAVIV